MRRFPRWSLLLGGLAAMSLSGAPALAVPAFDDNDLKGDYLFTVVEVHRVMLPGGSNPIEHCVIAGTATFDGAGTMTLSGTQRCSITGSGALSGTQYYVVNADGSFVISESAGMTDPVHGQIVDKGRTLLMDGTLRTAPDVLNWWGTAVKR